jgi:GntR family transcriptional regulator, transcriptional repressor for pyruvate dehydrogenase complex
MDTYKMNRQKIVRTTLVEQVVHQMQSMIAERQFQPGDPLPSNGKLAEVFGVSLPVVREAVKYLEAQGIVAVTNGKTAHVRPITTEPLMSFFQRVMSLEDKALLEFMEIRKGLEVQSASLAAQRRSAEDLSALQAVLTEMRTSLRDIPVFSQLDLRFHLLIAGASRNTMLARLVESIRQLLKFAIDEGMRSRTTDAQFEELYLVHERIVAALVRGDPDEAGQAMAYHFERVVMPLVRAEELPATDDED